MRAIVVSFAVTPAVLAVALAVAGAQSDKQQKLDAAKMENCPRLKAYFQKRARSCPKTAAKARAVECTSTDDHDELNGMLRGCAREIDVTAPPPPVEEGEAPICRAYDGEGEVLADLSESDAKACRKKMKAALVEKCGGAKKIVAQLHRKGRKPAELSVKCPRR